MVLLNIKRPNKRLYYFILATATEPDISIDLQECQSHRDDIDRVVCILSYTIRGIISLGDRMIDISLLITVEYLLSEEGSGSHGDVREVFLENIGCTDDTLCLSTSDESVGSHACLTQDISRNCEYISSMVECELGCDEGSTFYSCLWYDDPIRECCDDLVADREHIGLCLGADREYRDECSSALEYSIKKPRILYWIVDIHATTEYGYCISTAGKCDLMRYRIDPVCSTTHDPTSSLHEIRYDIFEDFFAIARIASRTDYAEHLAFLMEITTDIEEIGCLLDRAESLWIYI